MGFARDALTRPLPAPVSARAVPLVDDAFWAEAEAATRKAARGAEAPLRALACLRRATEAPFPEAMGFERQTFLDLRASTDYAAIGACDLVIEAVFEQIDVKRAVFDQLARHARPDAVLATNTSYLDPRDIARGLPDPARFLGLHFFSPAHVMRLLEIVPTPDTAPDVLATGFDLARRLDKIPVQSGICDGFIGNRILKRSRAEAEALLREGILIAAVDAAMRAHGLAMGPFEAQDLGGLDIAHLQRQGARAAGQTVPDMLADLLVEAGRKGQKTGGGWYDYAPGDRSPRPSQAVARLLAPHLGADPGLDADTIARRMIDAMADEGRAILAEGIADSAADIDLVMIHGYGHPRWRGGPMFARLRG